MVVTTLENVCGNGYCQVGETVSNCAKDCSPQIKDYLVCIFDSNSCQISSYTTEISMFVFFVFLVIFFVYLKRKKIL